MNTVAPAPTPTTRALTWCLHLLVIGLLTLAAGRAVAGDPPHPGGTVAAAALCASVYATGPLVRRHRRPRRVAALWLAAVGVMWLVLLALSPEAVWVAFPLYFLQLHLLPRRAALVGLGEVVDGGLPCLLHMARLDDATLPDALERLCATTSARHRLTARFRLTGAPAPLPAAHEVALLRIAQSALANTVRHAEATTADVTLGYHGDHVALGVADDGRGFDPEGLPAPDPTTGGFGLVAMRARAQAAGGTLAVDSAADHGTTLTARLPLTPSSETRPEARP
ncbi:hypothetical protein JHN52_00335 [Streptomyces sp. MBT97]|uniref:sensor histidine kinase n=1 Tax=Streptomyces sp. MBT97 TaxID=2800411 RepID=UPI0019092AED|nr:ATP-binding protein [Streptomyces sp. MBT97]MBK3631428.1 hypothetical protein [Streptomyces sp. MBT97]